MFDIRAYCSNISNGEIESQLVAEISIKCSLNRLNVFKTVAESIGIDTIYLCLAKNYFHYIIIIIPSELLF